MKLFNPPKIAAPAATYSHGVEIAPNARWLYVAGQVGTKPDGTMAPDIEGQAEQTWLNVVAILEGGGMNIKNLVKVTSFLTRPQDVPAYAKVRDRFLGDMRPATTMIVVQALARPGWLIEVEAIAAND
jgi:enamine deaminase RidA (YjgF/YER057c/UK114 family)